MPVIAISTIRSIVQRLPSITWCRFCGSILLSCCLMVNTQAFASDPLDQPIFAKTGQELVAAVAARSAALLHGDGDILNKATTHIMDFAYSEYDPSAGWSDKEALLAVLTDGRTPRQLIVLGAVIQIQRMRLALAQDFVVERPDDTSNLALAANTAKMRRTLGEAELNAALETLRKFVKRPGPG